MVLARFKPKPGVRPPRNQSWKSTARRSFFFFSFHKKHANSNFYGVQICSTFKHRLTYGAAATLNGNSALSRRLSAICREVLAPATGDKISSRNVNTDWAPFRVGDFWESQFGRIAPIWHPRLGAFMTGQICVGFVRFVCRRLPEKNHFYLCVISVKSVYKNFDCRADFQNRSA